MREDNAHGAAGDRAWLRPSVCVRTIGTRCRRGVNRQGSEVENLPRVTPGYVRDAGRQTNRQIYIVQKINTPFCKLRTTLQSTLNDIVHIS